MLSAFPIASPPPDPSKVQELLNAQSAALDAVHQDLGQGLVNQLMSTQAELDRVKAALKRKVSGAVKANGNDLATVIQPINLTVGGLLSSQQADLNAFDPVRPINNPAIPVAPVTQPITVDQTYSVWCDPHATAGGSYVLLDGVPPRNSTDILLGAGKTLADASAIQAANPSCFNQTTSPVPIPPPLVPPISQPPIGTQPPPIGQPPVIGGPPPPPPLPPPPISPPINTVTCEFPPTETIQIACGSVPPPPPPIPPFWLIVECDGCGWKWCIFQGTTPPQLTEGQAVFGPFASPPDPLAYIHGVCKKVIGPPTTPPTSPPIPGIPPPPIPTPAPPKPSEPPPPVPVPTQPPTTGKCDLGPYFKDGLPLPGTEGFCKAADDLLMQFVNLSAWVIDKIKGVTDGMEFGTPDCPAEFSITDPTSIFAVISCAIETKIKDIGDALKKQLLEMIDCWQQLNRLTVSCRPDAVLALMIVKLILQFLSKFTVGWTVPFDVLIEINVIAKPAIKLVDWLMNYACPQGFPSSKDAIGLYLYNEITEEHCKCILALHGQNWQIWRHIVHMQRGKLTAEQRIEYGRRNGLTDQQIQDSLREIGWIDYSESEKALALYRKIPSVAETLWWEQHKLTDPAIVDRFGLDSDFDNTYWSKWSSVNEAQGITRDNARMGYIKGWALPSLETLNQMRFRLRPGRTDSSLEFNDSDYEALIDLQGLPEFFRERYEEIRYTVPGIRHLRNNQLVGTLDEKQAAEAYQDIGFSPEVAERFAYQDRVMTSRQRESQIRGFTPSNLSKYYALGLVTTADVQAKMGELGYTQDEAQTLMDSSSKSWQSRIITRAAGNALSKTLGQLEKAYNAGAIDRQAADTALQGIGFPANYTGATLDALDLGRKTDLVTKAIALLGRAIKSGEITIDTATTQLAQMGVSQDKQTEMTQLWQLELSVDFKQLAASKVLQLVREGLLNVNSARTRLGNLHYHDIDAALLLAETEQKRLSDQEKALAGEERTRAANARKIEQAIKAGQVQQTKLQHALCRTTPVSKLQRWYVESVIGEQYMRDRLTYCGYTPEVIDKYVLEAQEKKGSTNGKAITSGSSGGTIPPG